MITPYNIIFIDSEVEIFNYLAEEKGIEVAKLYHDIVKKSIIYNNASSYDKDSKIIGGNITDKALLEFIKTDPTKSINTYSYVPFSSKYKYSMISLNDKEKITLIKGSPEKILQKCETYYDEFCIKRPFIKKDNYIQRIINY